MNVGSTPFFAYEGLRILIPGSLAYGLLLASIPVVEGLETIRDGGTGVVITLSIGFFLYFVDLPAFGPLYRNQEGLQFFESLGAPAGLDHYEIRNRYFIAFDTLLPPALRDRSSYFLEIYRIGFESILLLVVGGIAFWLRSDVFFRGPVVPLGGFLCVIGLMVIGVVVGAENEIPRENALTAIQRAYSLFGITRIVAVLLPSIIGFVASVVDNQHILLISISIPYVLWIWWYVAGLPRAATADDEETDLVSGSESEESVAVMTRHRAPLPLVMSLLITVLLFLIPISAVTDWRDWWFKGDVNLTVILWLILALAPIILLASNGHERRFLATNYEQREWLELNEDDIRSKVQLQRPGREHDDA